MLQNPLSAVHSAQITQRSAANSTQPQAQNTNFFSADLSLNSSPIWQSLLQLIMQLLEQWQDPQPQPESLELSDRENKNLSKLLGFNASDSVTIKVLDEDGNGELSEGDTAVARDGITGVELARRTLSADDVAAITEQSKAPAEFLENRAKWEEALSQSDGELEYTRQRFCFCRPEDTKPMDVVEKDGEIVEAVYSESGEAVPENIRDSLLSVNEIFDTIEKAYNSGAEEVNVTYDEEYGYPTSAFINQDFNIQDEEVTYNLSNMQL